MQKHIWKRSQTKRKGDKQKHLESIDEFLSRGGKIKKVKPALGTQLVYEKSLFQRAKRGDL